MRTAFKVQYELGATPIENVPIPTNSRDELPPVLRALQYIYATPKLNHQVFQILQDKIMTGVKATGRFGMSLWEILVFAAVRLTLDTDYDRLHYMANYDHLVRSLLGIAHWGGNLKKYSLQTLKDNVQLLDETTIKTINDLLMGSAYSLLKPEHLHVKIDSYVLETNVHFPTDLNLLWDACYKSIELVRRLCQRQELTGWRKDQDWRGRVRHAYRRAAKRCRGTGKHTERGLNAVLAYLTLAQQLNQKLEESIQQLQPLLAGSAWDQFLLEDLLYFKGHLEKHIDLVRRRLIFKEEIPHEEKVFSLFEPYTEWIKKGKIRQQVELGLRLAVATDQHGLIIGYRIMQHEQDVDIAVPFAQELLSLYPIKSISFDKGFWSPANHNQLKSLVAQLIMPKKGKLTTAEQEREQSKTFRQLRRQHAAVESAINCLEHHGLNRCPDKGLAGFRRYTALGVFAYNLHKLGNVLLAQDKQELPKNQACLLAA